MIKKIIRKIISAIIKTISAIRYLFIGLLVSLVIPCLLNFLFTLIFCITGWAAPIWTLYILAGFTLIAWVVFISVCFRVLHPGKLIQKEEKKDLPLRGVPTKPKVK